MQHTVLRIVGAALAALALTSTALAQVTFYEGEGFRGRAFTTGRTVPNLHRFGYNDRASSVIVERGRWEVCEDANFRGRCALLRRGSYDSLRRMGLNDRVSSVRPADAKQRHAVMPVPLPAPTYEYRRRPNERVYAVPVQAVRAVVGPPEQRCWVERQQVAEPVRSEPNVGGAVVGAVIGGILGHQVGGGSGKDVATVGGAVAGAVIGANVGRDGSRTVERNVRRCETVASGPPAYWDVSYTFRGVVHHAQMSAPPGPTIFVNGRGEPRQ
jgi:uncharacterized protein YcfJ